MKKLFYLLLVLMPFSSISQVQDSLIKAIKEQGLNLLVIEPGDEPGGAQARPCGTVVVSVNSCCHVYQVICGGEVKWQSAVICNGNCYFMFPSFPLKPGLNLVVPTSENPSTEAIPFDVSLIIDKESLDEEHIMELKKKYSNFYFEVGDDIVVNNGDSYILYKKGNYKINKGEMIIKYYYTQGSY